MQKLVVHIPHAATAIPETDGFAVSKDIIENEILQLTDWYTDDLFDAVDTESIIFNYSRIFCDPERFSDDSLEPMAGVGMGVLYERTDDDQIMRVISPELREHILTNYYLLHHGKLAQAVRQQLEAYGKALILDAHSFPDIPLKKNSNKTMPRPDFNIGSDYFHTPAELIEISATFFTEKGFTFGINWPFSGSIVPMEFYRKNKQVASVMLEVNRRLYLIEGTKIKSANYLHIKQIVQEYMQLLKTELLKHSRPTSSGFSGF